MIYSILLPFLIALAPLGHAAVVITDFQVGPGGVGSNFTPTYDVSDQDLINGLAPAVSAGDFSVELSGGIPVLTNGTYGTITEPGGAPDRTHPALGVAGGGSGTGTVLVYNLAPSQFGYNIASVWVYGGWNDNGRDAQNYTFSYSVVGDPSFVLVATVNFNPTVGPDLQTANRSIILDNDRPFLGVNVDAVRFEFPTGAENGYTGYAELDVVGIPAIPEPSSILLLGMGLAGVFRRCRVAKAISG
jgi:hypothetical protein